MTVIFRITVDTPIIGTEELKCWGDSGKTTFEIVKAGVYYEVWADNGYVERFCISYTNKYDALETVRRLMKEAMKLDVSQFVK
jgi:hypothetical protein